MRIARFHFIALMIILLSLSCVKETPRPPNEDGVNSSQNLNLGCSEATYDDWETSEYVLPYPIGRSYVVNLSHCSGSYHGVGLPDQFAIDFAMGIGTPITASRDGVVVYVQESGYDGEFPNNKVVIQHVDGTYAQYMHLTHGGAEVKTGQSVTKGQLIGQSGSTGLAGYPHLHFVATNRGEWRFPYTSFPTTFSNTSKNENSLQSGQTYRALPF